MTLVVCVWGLGVAAAGVAPSLWLAVTLLGVAGAADLVSSVFRQTMLQVVATDEMRGRMQGVYVVVVAGGPRLGDLWHGLATDAIGTSATVVAGGLGVVVITIGIVAAFAVFWRYRAPLPRDAGDTTGAGPGTVTYGGQVREDHPLGVDRAGAGPRLGFELAGVLDRMAGRAPHPGVDVVSAAAVSKGERRALSGGQPAVRPPQQGHHHGQQIERLLGEQVLVASAFAGVLVAGALQHVLFHEGLEPGGHRSGGQAGVRDELVEPGHPVERLPHDLAAAARLERVQRPLDGVRVEVPCAAVHSAMIAPDLPCV